MTIEQTVRRIIEAPTWDQRIAQIRLIPQRHGTGEHAQIHAEIARSLYVPHLAPDFAYIHNADFYGEEYFREVYAVAYAATAGFTAVNEANLASAIRHDPRTLLVFRTIVGLTKEEFSHSTKLAGETLGLAPLSPGKVDAMERRGTATSEDQARVASATLRRILDRSLFGDPPGDLRVKQDKPDTRSGWATVGRLARDGVPLDVFLHQRHYGGAFRQVLDATSKQRGDLIESAVESVFKSHGIPYLRTGAHNQADIAKRFEVHVTPAPDFVVFDASETLRAMLECKGTNNGGTARDKALRFERLKAESTRLGGVPLIAVLGGMGWTRVNDTLGPVVRDTDGRVFTVVTLEDMIGVSPFPSLVGLRSARD